MSIDRAVRLSNRQYSFLREVHDKGGVELRRMLALSQTTAGSVVLRGFVSWDRQLDRFVLTGDGLELMEAFEHSDITRQAQYRPLSSRIRERGVLQQAERVREELKAEMKEGEQRKEKEARTVRINRKNRRQRAA